MVRYAVAEMRGIAPNRLRRIARFVATPWGARTCVALLVVALLGPFLGKAFHIDDTLFLAAATRIVEAPLDPYGFEINWFGAPESMWRASQNPPANAYLVAGVLSVAGYREVVHHAVYLAIAIGAALLMLAIAGRLCSRPLLVVGLTVVSPAFVVSATSVMADLPLLACWLAAVLFTLRAAGGEGDRQLWIAGVAAAAAVMIKYFGIALLPLLVVYWWLRTRRLTPHLVAFALPVVALLGWGFYAQAVSGLFHPLAASAFSFETALRLPALAARSTQTLAFLGGITVWPLVAFPLFSRNRIRLLAVSAAAGTLFALLGFGEVPAAVRWLWCAMLVVGVLLLVVSAESWRRRPDAQSALLGLWLFGTIVFTAFFNWTVAARVLLPAVFPAALLVVRAADDRTFPRAGPAALGWVALPVAGLSLVLALADMHHANASRTYARTTARAFAPAAADPGARDRVAFLGHWGFQHYMEREGFPALDTRSRPRPSDLILVSYNNSNTRVIRRIPCVALRDDRVPQAFGLHVMNGASHAGYYSAIGGPVPFAPAGDRPTDRFVACEVLGGGSGSAPRDEP